MNLVKPLRVQASIVKKSAATITLPLPAQKLLPGGFPFTLRRRFQPMLLQNVGDRAARDLMA